MSSRKFVYESINFHLLGNFNPSIINPSWLAAKGLIREGEGEAAKIEVITRDISIFELEWCRIQVTDDRFFAETTKKSHFETLEELVVGIFRLLEHTPIRVAGINNATHFGIESEDAWHNFGHKYAPKEIWNEILTKPGMQRLTIRSPREDEFAGYLQVTLEPSVKVSPYGIFISVNDHCEVQDKKNVTGSYEIISILEKNWPCSLKKAAIIFDRVSKV